MVKVECLCPSKPGGKVRHPAGDRIYLRDKLDLRSSLQLQGRLEPSQPATMEARFVLRVVRDRGAKA